MAEQLKNAVKEMEKARALYLAAKSKRAMRDAGEEFEFWSNKAAMLEVMVLQGGAV